MKENIKNMKFLLLVYERGNSDRFIEYEFDNIENMTNFAKWTIKYSVKDMDFEFTTRVE